MRLTVVLSAILFCLLAHAQDHYILRGYVTDENAKPLAGVNIRIQNSVLGGTTNSKGQYSLRVSEGLNKLVFTYVGFETKEIEQVMRENTVLNVTLKAKTSEIDVVQITKKRKDYSYTVIKKTIENRAKYRDQYTTQKCNVYIKSVEVIDKKEVTPTTNPWLAIEIESDEKLEDEKPKDTIPNLNLFEADIVQHSGTGHDWKEDKVAAKGLGDQRFLFFTSTTDANFIFEDNLIYAKKLSDNQYISPISATAFAAYKYKLLGSAFEDGIKYYRIKVIPRKLGNALFSGEIHIWDSLYTIKYLSLSVPKNSLIKYQSFSIEQDYQFVNNKRVLKNQGFNWTYKQPGAKVEGKAIVKYSNYLFDSTYSKRYFNAEVGKTREDAYEKDTGFWNSIRPVPLTKDEQEFIEYKDSIKRLHTSKEWLDSIDAAYNKITPLNLLLNGQGHINREKKTLWSFDPLVSVLDPLAIGGWRVKYGVSYYKKFENRKNIRIQPSLNYGFLNQDIKGNLHVSHLYDPMKRSSIDLNTGKYFGFVNQFATFGDILRRSNFYEQTYVYLYHRRELINGLYLRNGVELIRRDDLNSFQFTEYGDSLFTNNYVATFPSHTAFNIAFRLEYTPKQLYLQEPKEKIILGSRYPTFSINYKQAIRNVFGSATKFKYLDFAVDQTIAIGIFGTSQYKGKIGMFLDTTDLKIMDYIYQRGGDPVFFLPPMYGYQLIDSTFAVFRPFLETHYAHQFNGFITSKIPGIKHIGIKTTAGAGLLIVPERKYQYSEVFFGANRVFKIGKVQLRLGGYYILAQSNTQGFTSGFKFSVEPYNAQTNTWAF